MERKKTSCQQVPVLMTSPSYVIWFIHVVSAEMNPLHWWHPTPEQFGQRLCDKQCRKRHMLAVEQNNVITTLVTFNVDISINSPSNMKHFIWLLVWTVFRFPIYWEQ